MQREAVGTFRFDHEGRVWTFRLVCGSDRSLLLNATTTLMIKARRGDEHLTEKFLSGMKEESR